MTAIRPQITSPQAVKSTLPLLRSTARLEKALGLDDVQLPADYTPPPINPADYRRLRVSGEALPAVRTEGLHPAVRKAKEAAVAWCKSVRRGGAYWLTLYGPSGTGKTLLARHARVYLRQNGIDCQLWNWNCCFARLADRRDALLQHLCRLPALVLDDFGAGFTATPRAAELHAALAYELMEERGTRPTFLTTNLSPHHIAETLDSRLASRLLRNGAVLVDLSDATDFNLNKLT